MGLLDWAGLNLRTSLALLEKEKSIIVSLEGEEEKGLSERSMSNPSLNQEATSIVYRV